MSLYEGEKIEFNPHKW